MTELERMCAEVLPPEEQAVAEGRRRLLATAHGAGSTATGRPLRRRRLVIGAVGVAVLGMGAAVGVATLPGAGSLTAPSVKDTGTKNTMRLASAVRITRKGGYFEARIVDPTADQKRLTEAFAKHGFNIRLSLVPVSPSVVGTIVFQENGDGIKYIADPSCRTASRSACVIGLRIPHGFKGDATVTVGREAAPGEKYVTTSPADAPKGLAGRTVAQAEAAIAEKGLKVAFYNVYWYTPQLYGMETPRSRVDDRWKVTGAEPYSKGTVFLFVDGAGPVPPEVIQKMRNESTAAPTRTPIPAN